MVAKRFYSKIPKELGSRALQFSKVGLLVSKSIMGSMASFAMVKQLQQTSLLRHKFSLVR
jgi:hypothetical protein